MYTQTEPCAWEGCENPSQSSYSNSKSKYCTTCAPKAREAWRKARDEQQEVRDNRYAAFQTLWDIAVAAGVRAFDDAQPVPMVVQQHANVLDDSSEVIQQWNVPDGVCGMAWLVSRPGGSSFSHWVAKTQGSSAAYRGGKYINLPFGRSSQSLERKTAGANAMADVLEEGLKELDPKTTVWAHSRID